MYEQQSRYTHPDSGDEIDLRELFGILWEEKKLILSITGLVASAAVVYALMAQEIYRAEVVLVPAEARQSASPLLNQLGGAAALIGINVGSQGGGTVDNAIAIMRSREFIGKFIKEHEVLVPLFAGTWSRESGSGIDESIFDPLTGEWQTANGAPTELVAYRTFRQLLSVTQDSETGIISVAVEWHDPELATAWTNQIIADINRDFKIADVQEANEAIVYLRNQLETTQLVDMQRVFYQLIESQTRVTMLADVREEYVFQIIDPAVVPDLRIFPRRSLIAVLGAMTGGMLGLFAVFIRRVSRKPIAQ
jgi:uncharacterized protein involved in exopolysaccharide biosynthesis